MGEEVAKLDVLLAIRAELRPHLGDPGGGQVPVDDVVGTDGIDAAWLAKVRAALEPLGVSDLEVSAASLEAAFLALTAETTAETTSQTSDDLIGSAR